MTLKVELNKYEFSVPCCLSENGRHTLYMVVTNSLQLKHISCSCMKNGIVQASNMAEGLGGNTCYQFVTTIQNCLKWKNIGGVELICDSSNFTSHRLIVASISSLVNSIRAKALDSKINRNNERRKYSGNTVESVFYLDVSMFCDIPCPSKHMYPSGVDPFNWNDPDLRHIRWYHGKNAQKTRYAVTISFLALMRYKFSRTLPNGQGVLTNG